MKQKLNLENAVKWMLVGATFALPVLALAQLPDPGCIQGLNCTAGSNLNQLIRTIISWLLGLAFLVAVLFLILGGFQYITSAGNAEQAEAGKGTAINALIGIVIIIMSYVIVNVVSRLVSGAGPGG